MANHEWGCCSLFFGECQGFVCKVAYNITIACYITPNPEAVEDQEQQQRVFGSFSQAFGLFNQQTRLFNCLYGFWCRLSFHVHEWIYECHLQPDFFATQRRSAGRHRYFRKGTLELFDGFKERRALQRPLTGSAPPTRGLLDKPGFGAMAREQLGLAFYDICKLAFNRFGDAGMKRSSRVAQEGAIGRVLQKCMLK